MRIHKNPSLSPPAGRGPRERKRDRGDRKSTRLNSSHANISYAVFCLKKKKEPTSNQGGSRIRNQDRCRSHSAEHDPSVGAGTTRVERNTHHGADDHIIHSSHEEKEQT